MNPEFKIIQIPNQLLVKCAEPNTFGAMFSPTCDFTLPKHPIPVTIGFDDKRMVGFCDLYMEGGNLMGTITLNSPEVTKEMLGIADFQISGSILKQEEKKVTEFISKFDTKRVIMTHKYNDTGFK